MLLQAFYKGIFLKSICICHGTVIIFGYNKEQSRVGGCRLILRQPDKKSGYGAETAGKAAEK